MPLVGTISQSNTLRARLSVPAPDTKYVISGIKVNNNEAVPPDDEGLIHLWVTPAAIVADAELSKNSTNVVTNRAISDFVIMTSEEKQALIALLND